MSNEREEHNLPNLGCKSAAAEGGSWNQHSDELFDRAQFSLGNEMGRGVEWERDREGVCRSKRERELCNQGTELLVSLANK